MTPYPYANLHQIPGNGVYLARTVGGEHQLPMLQVNQHIGAVPRPSRKNPLEFTNKDILDMIVFYSENFGIVASDSLYERRRKFKEWLTSPI